VDRVLDSIQLFLNHLADVDFRAAAIAVSIHIVRGLAVSRAWRNVIADAYPAQRVRWRTVYGSYLAGVGVNALIPARAGDAVRLYLLKGRIPGATYTTLGTTLLVMSIFDFLAATAFFVFALTQGVLPSLDVVPKLPSFDFGWLFQRPRLAAAVALGLGIAIGVAIVWALGHVRAFKARVAQGFSVMRDKTRYLRRVVAWQAVDWTCRIATTFWFLRAFHVDATVRNALVAQVAQSLSTALPISPGGIGTEQALLVVVLRGEASRSALLSLSVGMKLTILSVNLVLGALALLLMARTLDWRKLRHRRELDDQGARPPEEAAAERPARP
jgi:glycosyltransferase 2 family protein